MPAIPAEALEEAPSGEISESLRNAEPSSPREIASVKAAVRELIDEYAALIFR